VPTARLTLIIAALLPACSDDAPSPDAAPASDAAPGDAAPEADAGPAAFVVGSVQVVEETSAYATSARVRAAFLADGAPPWHMDWPSGYPLLAWHQETMAIGACRLLEYQPAFCTSCTAGLCVADEVCAPYPLFTTVGTLTVTGLAAPITIEPDAYRWYSATGLPADLFAPDAVITAGATGGEVIGAFTLTAGGATALVTDTIGDDQITLTPGTDFAFSWAPADVGARVRLTLNANNAGHGAPFAAMIVCEVDDAAGGLTVPAAIIDAFPRTERWEACAGSDCPDSWLMRYRRAAAPAAGGEVEVVVGAVRRFWVIHHP
jgi:hypothetical protein